MIARAYLRLHAAWRRLLHLGDVGFVGFWLGVLGRDALHAVDGEMYRRRSSYHGEEHNTRGLFDWEREALEGHFPERGRLAVIGAGGGREVIALSRMGWPAWGFECNEALVETAGRLLRAERTESHASVAWLPRDEAPPAGEPYDGAIVGWSAYMLIAGRARRVRFLSGLRETVRDDAPVLVSFYTRPGDTPRLRGIARVAGTIRGALGREPVEVGDDLAPNYVHRFTRAEIEAELAAGGFRLVAFRPEGSGPYDSGYAVGRAVPRPAEEGSGSCDSAPTGA